ncbi:unnamed protein product [Urochloa humidicola]
MSVERAHWPDENVQLLLDLVKAEKEKYNMSPQGFLSDAGWKNVYAGMRASGLDYTPKQIQNKLTTLRSSFQQWKGLQKSTGLGRNPQTGGIVGEDEQMQYEDASTDDIQQGTQAQQLHDLLVHNHGLQDTRGIDSVEGLAMFLWTLATHPSQREMKEQFGHALGTVSKRFGEVLDSVASFTRTVIRPKDPYYRTLPDRLAEYSPLFDGCIGAIDGTHIKVRVRRTQHDDFLNRKSFTSQNVVAVCDFDMRFTYVGVGMAGACHDMAVLREAWAEGHFPHPPPGRYYLVDSGYASERGYLTPHRKTRYHLQQFMDRPPRDLEELFNKHHSKLRNVIERGFGVVKSRWKILGEVPLYGGDRQSKIIVSCFGLHNYLVDMMHPRPAHVGNLIPPDNVPPTATHDMGQLREIIAAGLALKFLE